jgi:hydrogenase small subunit
MLGGVIRTLRGFTEHTVDREPKWRNPGTRLDSGYDPPWKQ